MGLSFGGGMIHSKTGLIDWPNRLAAKAHLTEVDENQLDCDRSLSRPSTSVGPSKTLWQTNVKDAHSHLGKYEKVILENKTSCLAKTGPHQLAELEIAIGRRADRTAMETKLRKLTRDKKHNWDTWIEILSGRHTAGILGSKSYLAANSAEPNKNF
ncbi:hypothetical protein T265_12105 [Opisthorchis viverrini]|uniref:Uncharacterized protein n=1 Tax=Opisthorchis viverrini TaxID=6198 RepID=A0A074YW45_OPIVI|nr:hypothetical protein T265_12105 [Opisthorchis viverrini]KER18903.1 hypothetical protein T265_12105 [Opisthorchis viverrini]